MKRLIATLMLLCISFASQAVWLNTSGKVTGITTYAGRDTVLITLDSPGTTVSECASDSVFAIGHDYSAEQRARMYAMFLAAQASDRRVTVSYNDTGNCEPWGSTPSVYRRIVRMTLGN